MTPHHYAEVNPPFSIPNKWRHKIRPLSEWPHDLPRMFMVTWKERGDWRGMWGHYDAATGRFRADAVMHRTNALAGTPTHFVDDRV